MAGRRGARSGRGWDAIPPKPADEDHPGGELRPDDPERGNVTGRRRRSSPGGSPYTTQDPDRGGGAFGSSGSRSGSGGGGAFGGSGSRSGSGGGGAFGGSGSHSSSGGGGAFDGSGSRSGSGDGGLFGDPDHFDLGHDGAGGRPLDRGHDGPGGHSTDSGRSESYPLGGDGQRGDRQRGGGQRGEVPGRDRRSRAAERPTEPPRSESETAREICLRQLAVRPRTRAELAKVLARKEISDEVIAEVLDRYDEVGIIDDAAFARMWVSTRHQGRGLARRALADELRRHGVDAEVATEALDAVDDDAEATTARALVDRKLRSARGTPDQVFRRLVGMLARKGYPAGVAIRAVKDALAARDAEAAEFADQIDADALADEATDSLS
jgi:regulatory protein